LLKKGYIHPSVSPWGTPIIFVNEKGQTFRLCIDFRQLNKVTLKNKYPFPRIDDLFDQLKRENIFSKIDLISSYHQVRIKEEYTRKRTFQIRYGHYEFVVVPFGLTNVLATFMCMMNGVFRDLLDKFFIVFLSDIILYSNIEEEHKKHLNMVLQVLREHQLYAKLSKCISFYPKKIHCFGHIVFKDGITVDPKNIEDWSMPTNILEVISFMVLSSYHMRFIAGFSNIAHPITSLQKKGVKFEWSAKCEETF
jgi:hypothetical protein